RSSLVVENDRACDVRRTVAAAVVARLVVRDDDREQRRRTCAGVPLVVRGEVRGLHACDEERRDEPDGETTTHHLPRPAERQRRGAETQWSTVRARWTIASTVPGASAASCSQAMAPGQSAASRIARRGQRRTAVSTAARAASLGCSTSTRAL